MSNLTFEDKQDLNARGRAAGLGLDLWPEVATMEWRCDRLTHTFNAYPPGTPSSDEVESLLDEALRVTSRRYTQRIIDRERELLLGSQLRATSPEKMWASTERQMSGMQGVAIDFSNWYVPPADSPGLSRMELEESPLLSRLKALFRRISPWGR